MAASIRCPTRPADGRKARSDLPSVSRAGRIRLPDRVSAENEPVIDYRRSKGQPGPISAFFFSMMSPAYFSR